MEIDRDQYANRHEAIFGKRTRTVYVPPPLPGAIERNRTATVTFGPLQDAMSDHLAGMRSVTSWPDTRKEDHGN